MDDEYIVCCNFDVSASSPLEAAKTINDWLNEGGEWVFKLQNKRTKELFSVDVEVETVESLKKNEVKIFK